MNAFWHWWQHLPGQIDPVIFQIGSFRLQYYGLMYLVAFATTYMVARYRLKSEKGWTVSVEHLQGVMTAMNYRPDHRCTTGVCPCSTMRPTTLPIPWRLSCRFQFPGRCAFYRHFGDVLPWRTSGYNTGAVLVYTQISIGAL